MASRSHRSTQVEASALAVTGTWTGIGVRDCFRRRVGGTSGQDRSSTVAAVATWHHALSCTHTVVSTVIWGLVVLSVLSAAVPLVCAVQPRASHVGADGRALHSDSITGVLVDSVAEESVAEYTLGSTTARGTDRPLIGILSQSIWSNESSYIAASYVKFVEAAGARAVPILQDMPREEIQRRFNAVNGVLIPGGAQNLSAGHPYYDATKMLLDMTIEENDKGVFFPLHGTCLGFEALAVAVSGNASVMQDFDASNYPQPLIPTFTTDNSRFFSSLPKEVRNALYEKPYAMENHVHGVGYGNFVDNPSLADFFDVLTYSFDRQEQLYISTMEAKAYPVSATQWHPEKNAFEWSEHLDIPHDPMAVLVTQTVANAFVNLARRNAHAPVSRDEEEDLLIYNWSKNLEFTGRDGGFDQVYVFPPWHAG